MPIQIIAANVNEEKENTIDSVINWLKKEFEKIDAYSNQMKANRIEEAAKKLEEIGLPTSHIAAVLVYECRRLHVSRSWIYKVIPEKYKDLARSEATQEGLAARRLQVDVPTLSYNPWPPAEKEERRKFRLDKDDLQRRLRDFDELMWSARTGGCSDCNCANCKALRSFSLL